VARQLGFLPGVFDLSPYDEATARRHRKIALDYLGFRPFDAIAKQELIREIRTLVRSQVRPKAMFLHALDTLASRKTEIPGASLFTDLITAEMTRHKGTLTGSFSFHVGVALQTSRRDKGLCSRWGFACPASPTGATTLSQGGV